MRRKKKLSDIVQSSIFTMMACLVILLLSFMMAHIIKESVPAWKNIGSQMFAPKTRWLPVSNNPQFGLLPMIFGTVYISALAVIFAMFFGIGCSIYLNFYMKNVIAKIFLSIIDMVAGIPSVIFGMIGLTLVVRIMAIRFKMPAGHSVLAASIVLGVMLIPFVVSSCSESIREARKKYEFSALALGFSKEQMILKIIFPAISRGIVASAMMALGRGLGETMAVMMVAGNSPIYPKLLGRAMTLPSLTALEMGSIEYGSIHLSVLYVANVVLLLILFGAMISGSIWRRRVNEHEKE